MQHSKENNQTPQIQNSVVADSGRTNGIALPAVSTLQRQVVKEEEPIQAKMPVEDEPIQAKTSLEEEAPLQAKMRGEEEPLQAKMSFQLKANNTGLPDDLKSGIESLSGFSMDDVRVHYNSPKPVQLQALAYAQGTDIHIGPGQETHLPHEAWHVVQQKQGRVQPTVQLKEGVPVNDNAGLEDEADIMGQQAMQMKTIRAGGLQNTGNKSNTVQMVKAYRVEYSHNRKVITSDEGTVTGITAPIDISFVLPDHSEYFASERKQEQIKGLRVVEWEMKDAWWEAVRHHMRLDGKQISGKAQAFFDKMDKKLSQPTWSDGASLTKFVKQTALHFKADWQELLSGAFKSGTGQVTDLEAEYYEKRHDQIGDGDMVWAYDEATDEDKEAAGFDESEYGPGGSGAFEMTKQDAVAAGRQYIHLDYARSLGYAEEEG
jgi:hypothetical protein